MIKIEKIGEQKRLEMEGRTEELVNEWIDITSNLIKIMAKAAPEAFVIQTMKTAFKLSRKIGLDETKEEKQEEKN